MKPLYAPSLALLTDLYELTMAYGYWKEGMQDDRAVFSLFFRKKPFGGNFAIAAGLESVIDFIQRWHFDTSDVDYLATLVGQDEKPLFEKGFLDYLSTLKFEGNLDAVREGEVVFPNEPLVRVEGPLIAAQLLESALLTLINFPTLIATKAARLRHAAPNDTLVEFGLRRAQGVDGAITATRAAYIGGCDSTSNTFGGKSLGIPVMGTHAHSWVLSFDSELESFEAFARALPGNVVLLVDTFDSLDGVRNAIEAGKKLRERGHDLLAIRLDSGDLAYLSIEARKILDQAGFESTQIVASNELNETLIQDLKDQGSPVTIWGVGTNLVTGEGQSALDGVYKLTAHKKKGGAWDYRLKLSENMTKVTNPGISGVRRYSNGRGYVADAIYDLQKSDLAQGCTIVDPLDKTHVHTLTPELEARDLLVPIYRDGTCVYASPTIHEMRDYALQEVAKLDPTIKRFTNPHTYPVGLEKNLYDLKIELVENIRKKVAAK